jgi:hypothetical protein
MTPFRRVAGNLQASAAYDQGSRTGSDSGAPRVSGSHSVITIGFSRFGSRVTYEETTGITCQRKPEAAIPRKGTREQASSQVAGVQPGEVWVGHKLSDTVCAAGALQLTLRSSQRVCPG